MIVLATSTAKLEKKSDGKPININLQTCIN